MRLFFYILIIIFFILSLMECRIADCNGDDRRVKPFLMPVLAGVYVSGRVMAGQPVDYLIVAALIAGFAGDTFLLRENDMHFILAGMGAFLTGHLLYLAAFVRDVWSLQNKKLQIPVVLLAVVYIIYIIVYGGWLVRCMEKPVCKLVAAGGVYAVLIGAMSLSAFARFTGLGTRPSLIVYTGTLLFIISDSILAHAYIKKQLRRFVMETYLLAQFLIVAGMIYT